VAVLVRAGQDRRAEQVISDLGRQLQPQSRAYGRIVEGHLALKQQRVADAVDAFTGAKKLADLWMTRFNLGVAYVEAGHAAEAISEFDACQKRRGEATAIFLDEVPSFRYIAPLSYWMARAQEGVGMSAEAAANYRTYLDLRGDVRGDKLAADARKRLRAK